MIVAKQNLVGWWCPSVGATGFRLLDRSGRNNHGTLTSMANDDWVVNGGKGALDFDGSNDHVVTSQTASVGTKFSAFGWIRKSTTQSQVHIVGQYQTTTNQRSWQLCTSTSALGGAANGSQLGFIASGDGTSVSSQLRGAFTNDTISDDKWYFVGVVFNSGIISLFLNGGEQTNISANFTGTFASPFTTNSSWSIGAFNPASGGSGFLLGQLDDIRVFNRALTPSEVRQLWQIGRGNMPLRRRRRYTEQAAGGFKGYWTNRQHLIGSGVY
ncbi:MAG: hypothetical protein RLZZ396_1905 [Planctomycetota bacterium]|jgi:hypothetical protein